MADFSLNVVLPVLYFPHMAVVFGVYAIYLLYSLFKFIASLVTGG
jgi:hypothetical protein